jgi:hypothetical protein
MNSFPPATCDIPLDASREFPTTLMIERLPTLDPPTDILMTSIFR